MKLLVTGAWRATADDLQSLREKGHEVLLQPQEKAPLICPYEMVDGVICKGLFLYHPIERFVNLRYIQLASAGFDRVPMDYVTEHRIEIHNARGVYSAPMAEFAMAGVLQLYKQTAFFRENQRRHCWLKHRELQELTDKTVLILGCGSVGTECARRFQAFGCRVIGIDIAVRKDEHFQAIFPLTGLDDLMPQADILILTLPLTNETRGLLNDSRLALLKPGSILVNIARGAVVDQTALLKFLPLLGGAILDVFDEEPLPEDSPLWEAPNVLITPHNSFVGDQVPQRLSRVILQNLAAWSGHAEAGQGDH